jgi:molybdate transport system substrate-binding protein
MLWPRVFICALILLPALAPTPAAGEEIVVFASASLADVFRVLGESFEKANPEIQVSLDFDGSGELARLIAEGARADLFASSRGDEMQLCVRRKRIDPGSVREFASNQLVAITPPGSTLTSLAGLRDSAVKKIAIGDPKTCPSGVYAMQSLKALGLWDAVSYKVALGRTVRQVLQFAEASAADVGFVYLTDLRASKAVRVLSAVPDSLHSPIVYSIGALSGGAHRAAALRFIDFVTGSDGQAALFEFGFGTAPRDGSRR